MEQFIINKAEQKLKELGIKLSGKETVDDLEELLRANMTPRQYDDFVWNLQLEILDQNGSPAY